MGHYKIHKKYFLFIFLTIILILYSKLQFENQTKNVHWAKLYKDLILMKVSSSDICSLKLIDLDFDNIPELIINYGFGNSITNGFEIFRIQDGFVKKCFSTEIEGMISNFKLYRNKENNKYKYIKTSYYGSFPPIKNSGKCVFKKIYEISYFYGQYKEDIIFCVESGNSYFDNDKDLKNIYSQLNHYYGDEKYSIMFEPEYPKIIYFEAYYYKFLNEVINISKTHFQHLYDKYFEQYVEQDYEIANMEGIITKNKIINDKEYDRFVKSFKPIIVY